ncbi:MAG: TonB-dependent receptor [Gemmatimonadaceae bacterium]|nr:TonB-dependent receptor [Gemmatimonadaceae bacterium]
MSMRSVMRVLLVGAPCAHVAQAQSSTSVARPAVGRLTGDVFDSLFTREPLADASIYMEGLDRVIITDANGRFRVDSVPVGLYRLTFFHASLEAAGLQAPTTYVEILDQERTEVRLSTPGYERAARLACRSLPSTSAPTRVLFGVAKRTGDASPVSGALVRASWVELTRGPSGNTPTRVGLDTRTSDGGGFVFCDLPVDAGSRLLVDAGDGSIGVATYWPGPAGASMQTIYLPAMDSAGRRARSVVLSAQGTPLGNATIANGTDAPVRSDARGQFALDWRGHPDSDLTVRAIGMQAFELPGDELASPPRAIAIALDDAGRRLSTVSVKARRAPAWVDAFEARRTAGLGSFVTRADIDKRNPSQTWQMLFGVPGIQINPQSGRPSSLYPSTLLGACDFRYFVDGVLFPDFPPDPRELQNPRVRPPGPLSAIPPTEVEAIEVYPRANGVPSEFGGTQSACGVIAIWTRKGGGAPARP